MARVEFFIVVVFSRFTIMPEISTKPYMLRAIYEWCTDSGYTPHLAVKVDGGTRVPLEFVRNGEIVLNISFGATSGLKMDNDLIHFNARFGGVSREISVPVDNVLAIYANENGQGMSFEVRASRGSDDPSDGGGVVPVSDGIGVTSEHSSPILTAVPSRSSTPAPSSIEPPENFPEPPKKGGKPTLTRIK